MRRNSYILSFLVLLSAVFGIQRASAAFIIDDDGGAKKENKFSLRQLRHTESPFSLSSLSRRRDFVDYNNNMMYALPPLGALPMNSVEVQSPVLLQKGHTMYIYNYKYKVKSSNPLPMFRIPTPADNRLK
ncbi:MAG: hypothetical protein QM610_03610 [Chitinophagaceae bacterium]